MLILLTLFLKKYNHSKKKKLQTSFLAYSEEIVKELTSIRFQGPASPFFQSVRLEISQD